jgi:hypothetical protein
MAIGSIGSTTVSTNTNNGTNNGTDSNTAPDVTLEADRPAIADKQLVRGSTKGNVVDVYL